MRSGNISSCLFLPFSLLLSILSFDAPLSNGSNSITPYQSLTRSNTKSSPNGIFELGFFTPGESHNYYIGIWFKQIPEKTVVWVANRETGLPTTTNSFLKIAEDGNLVLLNPSNLPIWSTNLSFIPSNSTIAVLLDSGNLVLRDGANASLIHWQSFDHPTNTWLPDQKLGMNKITGAIQRITSWKSPEDPAPGLFSLEIGQSGSNQFLMLWNGTERYWTSGDWNGQYFSLIPEMGIAKSPNFSFVDNEQGRYFTWWQVGPSLTARLAIMDYTGEVKVLGWLGKWVQFWSRPISKCEVYALCGSFGSCNEKGSPFCTCLFGFEPKAPMDWSSGNWWSGCKRKSPLACEKNGSKDKFLAMSNIKLPTHSLSVAVASVQECQLACLNNCSCTAYAFNNNCSIWNNDLLNVQQQSRADGEEGEILYLRLAPSELHISVNKMGMGVRAIAGVIVGVIFVTGIILFFIWRWWRKWNVVSLKAIGGFLIAFRYRDLQIVTKNFSDKLGGGAFGSVYKGNLPDLTTVAVKKLEGRQQGEKQFRMEVSTIGTIQHVNLIRLRGFCSEAAKRLLVYDYMPNGSLNSHLFNKHSVVLSWALRYQIIIGIAKGLAYLHEKCRGRIIHCDIKPENILLDGDFCPKVADFGLAKLIGREFSHVLTTLRGTRGYLAPEWLSGQSITPKADVYSYGMMVFEIISGRRNAEQFTIEETAFFPAWALRKINQGEIHCLLDCRLEGNANTKELYLACKVAGWCIQDNEKNRLTMGHVVQVLEGVLEINIPPVPMSLQILMEGDSLVSLESSTTQSSQYVSATSELSA